MIPGRFSGKRAVVTGAGRRGGIGEAIARRVTQEGGRCALLDLCAPKPEAPREKFATLESMDTIAVALGEIGEAGIAVACDVTDETAVRGALQEVVERLDGIDILFNNAGGGIGAGPVDQTPVVELDLAAWDYTVNLSLTSAFLCSKHAIPYIKQRGGGSIVSTTSISAYHGVAGLSAYSAAKYGVTSLTRDLAMELCSDAIRVNAIAPGITLTPYVRQRYESLAAERPGTTPEGLMENFVSARIPMGRAAQPSEMASVAAFLASEDASFMTGQTLFVDGGMRV